MTIGTERTYDSKCYDLAEHFAQDEHLSKEELHQLACEIQETVEYFFSMRQASADQEPPEPDGECYRGGEYAASVAHEMAEARKLK